MLSKSLEGASAAPSTLDFVEGPETGRQSDSDSDSEALEQMRLEFRNMQTCIRAAAIWERGRRLGIPTPPRTHITCDVCKGWPLSTATKLP